MESPLPFLAASQKHLLVGAQWIGPDVDGKLEFVAPLAINGRTFGGLSLRGYCFQQFPNERVMLQLEIGTPGIRTRTPLGRVEWRPLNQPHRNPPSTDPAFSNVVVWGTHIHSFEANWLSAEQRMRLGNLPFASEILPDFETYESLVDFVQDAFRIKGLELIEKPLWSARLI